MKTCSQFSIACSGEEKHSTQKNTKGQKNEIATLLYIIVMMMSNLLAIYCTFVTINSINLHFAVVQKLVATRVEAFHSVTTVLSVTELQQVEIVYVNSIIEKCVCMHLPNSTYLATFPSQLNVD